MMSVYDDVTYAIMPCFYPSYLNMNIVEFFSTFCYIIALTANLIISFHLP